MNEPKRRGRPPKAQAETPAEVVLIQAEMRRGAELTVFGSSNINPAQEYALRVWAGQSVGLSRKVRLARVEAALKAQGLSMEGVEL